MTNPSKTSSDSVKSVTTAFQIIECLKRNRAMRLTEIAEQTGIHKSTVFKHLNTLKEIRYVYKEEQEYRLGIPFADLGTAVTEEIVYDKQIEEAVDHLADRSEWIAGYAVKQQDFAFVAYLARNENVSDLHIERLQELHTNAAGKAILSQMSVDERRKLLRKNKHVAETEHTITDVDALLEEIRHTSERGIAFDRQEFQSGVRMVALPFEDEKLQKSGAIFVVGSADQLTGRWFEEDIPGLISSSIRKLTQ